jgi:dTDP-glucose 4,6-dehydratase
MQHLEKAVPRFITSCLLGEPITVHGDGSAARDWLFVDDHCDLLERCLAADAERVVGETFNVGTGRHRTVLEIANAVREAMGATKIPVHFIGDRPGQVFRHTCDASRAQEVLGWEPKTSFEQALERTIRWYRDHEAWWRSQMWLRKIPIVSASGKSELH